MRSLAGKTWIRAHHDHQSEFVPSGRPLSTRQHRDVVPSSGRWSPSGRARGPNLQQIVRGAPQRPLAVHLLKSSKQKLSQPSGLLHLTEGRFDYFFPVPIGHAALLRQKFPPDAINEGHGLRNPAANCSKFFAMFDPIRAHVVVYLLSSEGLDVLLAVVARIGTELLRHAPASSRSRGRIPPPWPTSAYRSSPYASRRSPSPSDETVAARSPLSAACASTSYPRPPRSIRISRSNPAIRPNRR